MNKLWWIEAERFQSQLPERARLLQFMHAARYDAEKVVYSSSLPGDVIYLIQQGSVGLYQNLPDQTRRFLTGLGPGDLFGSLSLVEAGYKEGLVIAQQPTLMLVLRKKSFEQLMKYFPSLGAQLIECLQHEQERQQQLRSQLNARQSYHRLCRLLLHFLDHPAYQVEGRAIRMQADTRELASLLGSRPEVVSQCLEQLEARQIISRQQQELTLRDRKALEQEV